MTFTIFLFENPFFQRFDQKSENAQPISWAFEDFGPSLPTPSLLPALLMDDRRSFSLLSERVIPEMIKPI